MRASSVSHSLTTNFYDIKGTFPRFKGIKISFKWRKFESLLSWRLNNCWWWQSKGVKWALFGNDVIRDAVKGKGGGASEKKYYIQVFQMSQ